MHDPASASVPLTLNPETIPQPLQRNSFWILWFSYPAILKGGINKNIKRPLTKNWQKSQRPFSALVPIHDPLKYGLGFVYTPDHNFICIDIDKLTPSNLDIAAELNSYTEISPSGNGLHIIVETDDKQQVISHFGKGRRDLTNKRDLFISSGFVTVTNNVYDNSSTNTIRTIPADELIQLLSRYFNTNTSVQPNDTDTTAADEDITTATDEDITTDTSYEFKQNQPARTTTKSKEIHNTAFNKQYIQSLLDKLPVKHLTSDIFDRLNNSESAQLDTSNEEEARLPWLMIGQALHHAFNGQVIGFLLWDNWSKLGNKYDPDTIGITWDSFKNDTQDRPITIGTIIKLAEAQLEVTEFRDFVLINKQFKLADTINNFKAYLGQNKIKLHYNELSRAYVFSIDKPLYLRWGKSETYPFTVDTLAMHIVSDFNMINPKMPQAFNKRSVVDHIQTEAMSSFIHPIKDYFSKCEQEWDGKSRINDLLETITVQEPQHKSFYYLALRAWLIQVVAGVCYNPEPNSGPEGTDPIMLNMVPIFVGDQGIGKTKWVKSLFPPSMRKYCVDKQASIILTQMGTEQTKAKMALSDIVVCNINEIDTLFSPSKIGTLKNFLDTTFEPVVWPYGKGTSLAIRRTTFIGSTNEPYFLTDTTGNRRFYIFHAQSLNSQHTIDMNQLWGEATHYYRAGEKWYFDERDPRYAEAIQTRDKINSQCLVMQHEAFALSLDDYYDPSQPKSLWIPQTIGQVCGRVWSGRVTPNSETQKAIKATLSAWLLSNGGAPPKKAHNGQRAAVLYMVPPRREATDAVQAMLELHQQQSEKNDQNEVIQ